MKKRRLGLSIAYLAYILLLLEISCRIYLMVGYGVPFLRPDTLPLYIYPELNEVIEKSIRKEDEYFDVLLLGASAIASNWGNVQSELKRQIPRKNIRIHNLATRAHTSLDSFYKYRHLEKQEFDLVLLYHGINEQRMNNIEEERFQKDYSHYHWYRAINAFEAFYRFPFLALPYAIPCIIADTGKSLGILRFSPVFIDDIPLETRKEHGKILKSRDSFKENISKIITLAGKRNEPLLLLSFAYHYPENYTLRKFKEKKLDYGEHKSPVEIWGYPPHVVAGLAEHNKVIKELAEKHSNVLFIDLETMMPKSGDYFDDICHFSPRGSALFAEAVVNEVFTKTPASDD